MKLSTWCKKVGISYQTGWNWFSKNQLPNNVVATQSATGTVIITELDIINTINKTKECVIYCRVSSHDKKDDLKRQIDRCTDFAITNGFVITKVYKEIASGMNDKRTQLNLLLNSTNIETVIVENKDRLTRFGFNYIETLLKRLNTNIIVINHEDNEENDLKKDLISVITSFCCRIYGMRRGYNKAKKIQQNINDI